MPDQSNLVTQIFSEFIKKLSDEPGFDPGVLSALKEKLLTQKDYKSVKDAFFEEREIVKCCGLRF